MKPYPVNFRQKIIDTYESEPLSQRQLAKRFGVTLSFVQKLLKQYRTTGDITPKVRQEQTPSKLNPEQLEKLAQMVAEKQDATLKELRERIEQELHVQVGLTTVSRMLRKLNLPRK